MKHLLFLAAILALSNASAISKAERPEYCDHGKAWGGATSCHNDKPSYTYDHLSGTCVEVVRGGCLRADNIFETAEECMKVCGTSDLAAKLKSGELKFDVFNFNSLIDSALTSVSDAMKWVGADPIDIDGFVLDQIPGLEIGLSNFSLHGLSNIVRVGDWAFDIQGITTYAVHGGVGIHDVSAGITTTGEIGPFGGDVMFKVAMNQFDVTFSFYVDLSSCTIGLDKFTLGDNLHIDIDIEGDHPFGDDVDTVIEQTTNALLTDFNETVEKATTLALGAINVCSLVMSYLG